MRSASQPLSITCLGLCALLGCTTGSGTTTTGRPEPEPVRAGQGDAKDVGLTTPSEPGVHAERAGEPVEAGGDGSGPLQILTGGELVLPSAFRPVRDEFGMTDEPNLVGWSPGTGEFVMCVESGGAVCESCEFSRPGTNSERVEVGEDCQTRVPKRQLQERLEAGRFVIADGRWLFGAEVVLVVSSTQGKPDSSGVGRGVVKVGARLHGDEAAIAWLERIEACDKDPDDEYCAPEVHLDAVAVSPDGQTIAVQAHTFAGEFSDTYPMVMLGAEQLAAAAHNAEGLARLKAGELDLAARHFDRVSTIDRAGWKGPYNLACVRARQDDVLATQRALEEAVRRGGDAVRDKAAKDSDLDLVRGEPWFAEL